VIGQGSVEAQVDGVERGIRLEPRARILDLACGDGRQTLELARRGYRVLGIDSREGPLAEARRAAREERLNVHFIHTDMRQISYRGEFDAVVNLCAPIGLFPNDRDHLRVLEGVRKGLKSGGKLFLDMLNKEWLMRHWGEGGNPAVFDFATGRLLERGASSSLRIYTLTELKAVLERAGLAFRRVWGGYEGQTYGMDSPRMVVLAERPAEESPRRPKAEELVTAIRIKGRRKGR
jgi:D-alanine-D-alanine ligase